MINVDLIGPSNTKVYICMINVDLIGPTNAKVYIQVSRLYC